MSCEVKDFAFLVLMYNHQKYILEHLESIKYIVINHGKGIDVQLIVNDDCSNDDTVDIVDNWIDQNKNLFFDVVKLYNNKNMGTCKSLCNMIHNLKMGYCKITAGDDVYSYENIFKLASFLHQSDIVSGVPLSLVDSVISKNNFDVNNIIATDVIYGDKKLITRFKEISVNNAPSMMYKTEYLVNENILKFVSGFDVVEDLPLQIAIAEENVEAKFFLVKKVYVYYRRTAGSTYMVESNRFSKDQKYIFEYLIGKESSFFYRLMLKNRLMCFASGNFFVKRFVNFSVFLYAFSYIKNIISIRKNIKIFDDDIAMHVQHYSSIKESASSFKSSWERKYNQ